MSKFDLEKRVWWVFLEKDLQGLFKEAEVLAERVANWDQKFHDYSFIVFPAAKGFEGFLKKVFLDRKFITEDNFYGKRFRVGKALNPSLDRRSREKEGVYDQIVEFCEGRQTADAMWDTWKSCRNMVFHWFPNEKNAVSYTEAIEKLNQIFNTMDETFNVCKINNK
jgi:hypothetical protein